MGQLVQDDGARAEGVLGAPGAVVARASAASASSLSDWGFE